MEMCPVATAGSLYQCNKSSHMTGWWVGPGHVINTV